ncbi:OLC1v1009921C1 [Oldenlandia corymbosa var. corymbosa]|uniref:OLC1v1009921C1 n=1 Tax=Oldenlandia corymbosa var. corymbosa TaxID=529605 RepID=A0AAV1DSF2_OLDCO|nr:OLC1v1009921C1 [Oldenlandia corymbosa var. corymbosa]
MRSCSKIFLGFVNVIVLAFAIFQGVFVLMSNHDSSNKHCYKNSGPAIFCISAWLVIISLLGLLGTCCKSKSLQNCYMWSILVTTIVGVTFTAFMFLTLPNESASGMYQRTQNGDWLKAFSPLMRRSLVNDKDWDVAETCLEGMRFCQWYHNHPPSLRLEYLRFLQIGCCKPPPKCGFVVKNDTYWEIPKSGSNAPNGECQQWAKGGNNSVCYDCDSCKAGYLAKFQLDWHADKGVFVVILVFFIINTSLSYWAFGLNSESEIEKEQRKYRNMVYV